MSEILAVIHRSWCPVCQAATTHYVLPTGPVCAPCRHAGRQRVTS